MGFSPLCPGLAAYTCVFPEAEAGVALAEWIPRYSDSSAPLPVQLKGKLPALLRASQGRNHSRCWLPLPASEASRLRKCETEFPLNQPRGGSASASPLPHPSTQHHSPALLRSSSAGPRLADLISPTEIVWVLTAQDNWRGLQSDLDSSGRGWWQFPGAGVCPGPGGKCWGAEIVTILVPGAISHRECLQLLKERVGCGVSVWGAGWDPRYFWLHMWAVFFISVD